MHGYEAKRAAARLGRGAADRDDPASPDPAGEPPLAQGSQRPTEEIVEGLPGVRRVREHHADASTVGDRLAEAPPVVALERGSALGDEQDHHERHHQDRGGRESSA